MNYLLPAYSSNGGLLQFEEYGGNKYGGNKYKYGGNKYLLESCLCLHT